MAGLEELKQAPDGDLVDLGSGGGFPGIPLAIMSGRNTTLCETVGKKADCLKSFIKELQFDSQISVSNCRSEELAVEKPNFYAVATARALSSLPSLLEIAAPLLMTKGLLVCYKSLSIDEELEAASKIEEKLGFKHISNRIYELSDKETKHQIVLYEKISEPSVKLPRKLGLAQKRPLV